jgi:heavy metal sensor kinase
MRMPGPGSTVESAALAVGRSTEDIKNALAGLARTLIIVVPLGLLVAGAGGVLLAGRALKPVEEIARTARAIEETDLSGRVPVKTRDELGRLGGIINAMIARLEQAFKRQKEFTADASHELRTPLSVIQAESTLALQRTRSPQEYQAALESIAAEAEHMTKIIDQLLVLARFDSGAQHAAFQDVSLDGVVREVAEDMDLLSREKGLELEVKLDGPLHVRGDPGLLRRLFINLIDNAVRYTPPGGKVLVSSEAQDHQAVVSVADTGIGISPEHLPRIFERFYRVDKARSRSEGGSGLGLAICKQVVELHGGRIEVKSAEGQGSTFTVLLPSLS